MTSVVAVGSVPEPILQLLEGRGFRVLRRTIDAKDLTQDAALLLVRAEGPAAFAALRARGPELQQFVVVLGDEPDTPGVEGLVDSFCSPAVPPERVVRRIETYLAPSSTRLPAPTGDRRPDEGAGSILSSSLAASSVVTTERRPDYPEHERLAEFAEPTAPTDGVPETDAAADAAADGGESPTAEFGVEARSSTRSEPAGPESDPPPRFAPRETPSRGDSPSTTQAPTDPHVSGKTNPRSPGARTDRSDVEPRSVELQREGQASEAALGAERHPPPADPKRAASAPSETLAAATSHQGPAGSGGFSPRLEGLLVSADRELFPDAEPLDFQFDLGPEDARALVPDEILEPMSIPLDPVADPLDAFTYLGAPPDVLTSARRDPSANFDPEKERSGELWAGLKTPSSEVIASPFPQPRRSPGTAQMPSTGVGIRERTVPADTGGEGMVSSVSTASRRSDEAREFTGEHEEQAEALTLPHTGAVDDEELAAALWAIGHSPGIHTLTVTLHDAVIAVTVANGFLVHVDAGIEDVAIGALRRRHRWAPSAFRGDDALERLVADKRVSRYEVERELRRARLEALYRIGAAKDAEIGYRFSTEDRGRRPILQDPFLRILVEGFRRRFVEPRLSAHVLEGELELRPSADKLVELGGVEPELIEALVSEKPVGRVLAGLPPEAGAAGVVHLLVALGHAEVLPLTGEPQGDPGTDAVGRLRDAVRLAREGDYFSILGVGLRAGPREIQEAYETKVRALTSLPLRDLSLGHLDGARGMALRSIEDAYFILRSDRWRHRYRATIVEEKPPP
ncbi:MAG: hypothetical protein AAGF12_04585 [Myxococcota bacterium]